MDRLPKDSPIPVRRRKRRTCPDRSFRWLGDPFDLGDFWEEQARRELSEDPATSRSNVDRLRVLLTAERNLRIRTDALFLLAFLRACRHNVGNAARMVRNYYQLKRDHRRFFKVYLPSDHPEAYDEYAVTLCSQKDKQGRAVIIMNTGFEAQRMEAEEPLRLLASCLELLMLEARVQVSGAVVLLDLAGYSLRYARFSSTLLMRAAARALRAYPIRLRLCLVFNEPYSYSILFSFLRLFLKEKLKRKLKLLGSRDDLVQRFVTREVLPEKYGGVNRSWDYDFLKRSLHLHDRLLRSFENFGFNKTNDKLQYHPLTVYV